MPITIKLEGIDQELDRINEEISRRTRRRLERDVDQLYQALFDATPVRTGRARRGWRVERTRRLFGEWHVDIENDVSYIRNLNMGSSRQAPARFIEQAALRFFVPDGVIAQVR